MKTYSYFPGCSLEKMAASYHASAVETARRLDVEFKEIEDWNCCGATAYFHVDELLAYTLCARNLAIAEREGDDLVAPCSGCFKNMYFTNAHLKHDPDLAEHINEAMKEDGLEFRGTLRVRHLMDVFIKDVGLAEIKKRVTRPLAGLRVAPYYGCQIVRPKGRFDDREEPTCLDELFAALGGTVVPFRSKLRCCGGMLMTTFEEVALKLNRDILAEAAQQRADVVLTTCPLCQMNLEAYQGRIGKAYHEEYDVPVLFFTQLLGVALGFTPREMLLDQMIAGGDRIAARLSEVPA
jgi:heterodisulfide reductase subunit B